MRTVDWYEEMGCPIIKHGSLLMFVKFYFAAKEEPCTYHEGCPFKNDGRCQIWSSTRSPVRPEVTNAQLADQLGISRRQVAKARQSGELPKLLAAQAEKKLG